MTRTQRSTGRCTKRTRSKAGKARQKLYKDKRWFILRARQLRKHPFCQCPHCREMNLRANVVDHIKPHRGDRKLFFDPANLCSMNKHCHDSFKQSEELGGHGFDRGSDERGFPLNQDHDWFSHDNS